jgi:hypothetical protein
LVSFDLYGVSLAFAYVTKTRLKDEGVKHGPGSNASSASRFVPAFDREQDLSSWRHVKRNEQ